VSDDEQNKRRKLSSFWANVVGDRLAKSGRSVRVKDDLWLTCLSGSRESGDVEADRSESFRSFGSAAGSDNEQWTANTLTIKIKETLLKWQRRARESVAGKSRTEQVEDVEGEKAEKEEEECRSSSVNFVFCPFFTLFVVHFQDWYLNADIRRKCDQMNKCKVLIEKIAPTQKCRSKRASVGGQGKGKVEQGFPFLSWRISYRSFRF
jgi:hypothetical protein